ncbi:MAG: nicotinamide riboside transporter PnuC [Candidatus Uhrbacteria bacterium]|nr:nicotinamide riboside transporter PnuC [Candidatus Uhrbacteria bacterium]
MFNKIVYGLGILASLGLSAAAYFQKLPFSFTETLGFVTGAWCVWLTVKENIWNWPIGIANSAFFLILFWQSSLFADAALQIVYIILGILGWYWWLYGGAKKTELPISKAPRREWIWLAILLALGTWAEFAILVHAHDAAPFLDALTTAMSLVAQYLLTKKRMENWYIWMSVDVIYVYLYIIKDLYLTAFLYAIFFLMCVRGLVEWKRTHAKHLSLQK